jgi:hypothetical protein
VRAVSTQVSPVHAEELLRTVTAAVGPVTFDDIVRGVRAGGVPLSAISPWLADAQSQGLIEVMGTRRHSRDGVQGVRQYRLRGHC